MALLEKYVDVFAWTYGEMLGLDPRLVVHSLNVDPGVKLVFQPARVFHTDVEAQITQEVKKLLVAGFIKPIQNPKMAFQHSTREEKEWSNPVLYGLSQFEQGMSKR